MGVFTTRFPRRICLRSCNPGCLKELAHFGSSKTKRPIFERDSKGGHNQTNGKFTYLILDHANDEQP